ncbi:MAG: glycosyltransferase family 9 protein [Planctomycetota bacterium]|nr:glycosyltransferase family 9 protein [Planctomycetota bacterium]
MGMANRYSKSRIRSIVVVFPSRIGNTIQAMPFLRATRKHYSESWITLLVKKPQADLLRHHGTYDDLIVFRRNTIWEIIRVSWILRRRRYDLLIDLGGLVKGGLVTVLSGAKRKLGYNYGDSMDGTWVATNQKIPPLMVRHRPKNNVDRYLAFARHLGVPVSDRVYGLEGQPEDRDEAYRILRAGGVDLDRPMVGLILDSARRRKLWQGKLFMEVAKRLSEDGYQVLIISNHPERVLQNGSLPPSCFDFTQKLNLRTLPPTFQKCSFVVGADTGPLHLAGASGTRAFALFGPTNYLRYMPMAPGTVVIQRNRGLHCLRRSRRIPCLRHVCMENIRPEDVLDAIHRHSPATAPLN